jgi:hypothetical protein
MGLEVYYFQENCTSLLSVLQCDSHANSSTVLRLSPTPNTNKHKKRIANLNFSVKHKKTFIFYGCHRNATFSKGVDIFKMCNKHICYPAKGFLSQSIVINKPIFPRFVTVKRTVFAIKKCKIFEVFAKSFYNFGSVSPCTLQTFLFLPLYNPSVGVKR